MTIHLYSKTKAEAFRLCKKAISQLGYSVQVADPVMGIISGLKPNPQDMNFLFFDLSLRTSKHSISILAVSSIFFANSGTFAAETGSEELFMETIHNMMVSQQRDRTIQMHSAKRSLSAA